MGIRDWGGRMGRRKRNGMDGGGAMENGGKCACMPLFRQIFLLSILDGSFCISTIKRTRGANSYVRQRLSSL
ncbi:hypothetical protein VNO77_23977 [Canavalia gladiata]|uniref:Uncharacterized protein n=1 Tax=Canavalia gladiata TaxID=3824 RepID=A0AAN9L7W8_CANGL